MASSVSDPNVPSGWIFSQGSDGAMPEVMQQFVAGLNVKGAPVNYIGDPQMNAAQPNHPNGILSPMSGNTTRQYQ
jgi:hypothetical protein